MGALHHNILALAHVQAELVHRGVLGRGGVTTGDIHCEDGTIFGPAFNRAYELESEYAVFPRVMIGPEGFAMLRGDSRLISCHHDLVDEIRIWENASPTTTTEPGAPAILPIVATTFPHSMISS